MEIDTPINTTPKKIYIAGACKRPNTTEAQAGSGIKSNCLELQLHLRTPGIQTIFAAELYAVKKTIELANNFEEIKIVSTSKRLIKALTNDFKIWEDQGWVDAPNSNLMKQVINRLRMRKAPTFLELLEDSSREMNTAKNLARHGSNIEQEDDTETSVVEEYHPTGAKLQAITQAIAYKLLMNNKIAPETKSSKSSIDRIQADIKESHGYTPIRRNIWHQLKRNKNCLRKHKEFLYKTIKGAYYVGKRWEHSESDHIRARARCHICETEESMDHILTKCRAPGQETVWKLGGEIWKKKYTDIFTPKLGEILGIASITKRNDKGYTDIGKTRLFQILISECTYLIWNLRCERVIQHESDNTWKHSDAQIKNRLLQRLNSRFRLDCIQTNTRKFDKKAIRESLVNATWNGILVNEGPNEGLKIWLRKPGVLVGI
ncbi:hypothetical protein AGABI2DRAFT_79803 [Agaricus bisporus var. bisporus H97]|uniref:hypothetical protein n=1 Tax=Agaricus bisporus var. bisporus (strain H97 / ATCC MYA-4626 / FGSC 10389) TaxID=936046 RepID=UPI00029F5629|nr:hypothetical protein AGABI2DRAFT_79803 [Agaricus bisporus var. bisporus H97]EKV41865.1 hypothetical protein AGABI2DRAFT_79803 [Agaricus bisporus var. bisporus H97]